MRTLMTLLALAIPTVAHAQAIFTFENDATIIVIPVPGVEWVGVESFYDVGFVDEPEGLTQISHLAEHLMCKADIGEKGTGVAWDELMNIGITNAETMGTLTHYDAMAPAASLDLILEIEAGRLRGIGFDQALLEHEASRCHAEASGIQMTPQAPMYKFALMAAVQGWRYGATEARVVEGLEAIEPAEMSEFLARTYVPSNLTLLIVGDVEAEDVKARVEQTIGAVPRHRADTPASIDFSDRPPLHEITWDSVPATIIGYAPPAGPAHRLVLSLYGAVLMQSMMADPQLAGVARITMPSSHLWPVGPLPMHVYATLADDVDAAHAEETIGAWIESRVEVSDADAAFISGFARQAPQIMPIPSQLVRAQAAQVRQAGMAQGDTAIGMVLANTALQTGLAQHLVTLYGPDVFDEVAAMGAEEMSQIVQATIKPDRRFITRLINEP